jgi:hypothetical protein
MPMLTIFVNIISRPYSRSGNQVHRRSFFFYIHNIDPYSNSKSRSLRPKFRFQIHVHFTVSFLSLVIFTWWTYSYNNIISPTCRQHSHRISICFPTRRQHSQRISIIGNVHTTIIFLLLVGNFHATIVILPLDNVYIAIFLMIHSVVPSRELDIEATLPGAGNWF